MTSALVQLLTSNQVSPQTRRVLQARLVLDGYKPVFFHPHEWQLIQQLVDAIVPQTDPPTTALCAALIDQALANGDGPGWRYAALPPAAESCRTALQLLADHLRGNTEAAPDAAHANLLSLLQKIQTRQLDTEAFPLSLWLEGFKFDVVRHWLSHPDTMAALDYRGFADDHLTPQDSLQEAPR